MDYKLLKYKEALEAIAGASDQANPVHLKVVAQTALDFEETTADELNHIEQQSEIAEYDKKLSEIAESEWRDTVLSKNYKSPFDEEE